jgi:hypothetical protein
LKNQFFAALLAASTFTAIGMASAADQISADEAPVADDVGGVKIGTLSCEIGGGFGYVLGSSKEMNCTFHSRTGLTETYSGAIRKMGVDVGFTTRGKLVWAVFAPTAGYHKGSLGGIYDGATVEATVGAGLGANVLVGGTSGSIQLQTVSVTGQLGLNLAATGTSLTLNPA